jgi:hypothetical protein
MRREKRLSENAERFLKREERKRAKRKRAKRKHANSSRRVIRASLHPPMKLGGLILESKSKNV